MNILERVQAVFDEAVSLRRDLHAHPELSEAESRTEQRICDYLDSIGVSYVKGVAGHGVVATIGTGKEPAVGIRGDIDALPILEETGLPYASQNPGVMHACGHDIHTAALLGTAKVLKGMEKELPGTVRLFFQPAEETTGGAKDMIEAGYMENPHISHTLGLHVQPTLPWDVVEVPLGKMNAATCEIAIRVRGLSCHGAHPEKGVDAILAASHIVIALQSISSRYFAPTTPVIVTIGVLNGGTKENIVAGEVHMSGTLRALENGVMARIKELAKRTAEETAKAYGAVAEVTFRDGYPALVNDRATSELVADTVKQLYGPEKLAYMDEPSLGADDFAYFANAAKSCYFNIGTLPGADAPAQSLHNERFAPDERCLGVAIAMEVAGALRLLNEEAE